MLVWRGWGIWGLVVPTFSAMVINESVGSYLGIQNYAMSNRWAYAAMLVPGSVAVWFLGRWLERRDAPLSVLNLETNEPMHLVKKHDLFWIPLKYWGLVCMAVGIYLALTSSPKTATPRASQQTEAQRQQSEQQRDEALLSDMTISPTALDATDPKNIALVQVDHQGGDKITVLYYGFSSTHNTEQMQTLLGKVSKAACHHLWMPTKQRLVFERCSLKTK